MAQRDVVVVGASAGGVEALTEFTRALPMGLPACVLVVLHVPAGFENSVLPRILSRAGPLPALHATNGDPLTPGRILVAPPDRHLVVQEGCVLLGRGPRENGHRPAIDVLFRSAATWLGPRVVGVILSGLLDDGAAGLAEVVEHGGLALVQDPNDAAFPSMPKAAMTATKPELVGTTAELAAAVVDLVGRSVEVPTPTRLVDAAEEVQVGELQDQPVEDPPGVPSGLSCPDCHGVLYEQTTNDMVRYRCRVGHAWSRRSLISGQQQDFEAALWMALRSLEERVALHRRLAEHAALREAARTRRRHEEAAAETARSATLIRQMLDQLVPPEDAAVAED